MECIINPEKDANIKMNCDVGAARFIEIPSATTINGTKIRPPPIPNRLDIIPAKKLAPAEKTSNKRETSIGFSSIFLLRNMYDAEEIRTSANKILKMSGDISEDTNAPSIVPGTAINPSFQPSESSIRFCLAYIAVEATELLNTANRLLLTANVGENPINVNTGTMIIPPPKPIIDPNIPATNPSGINQSCSNILYRYYFHFGIFRYVEFINKTRSHF